MRIPVKFVAAITLAVAVAIPGFSVVAADPEFNDHNCAGTVVAALAGPDFGAAVAEAAHLQLVDNFGFANCGQTNRNNP